MDWERAVGDDHVKCGKEPWGEGGGWRGNVGGGEMVSGPTYRLSQWHENGATVTVGM